MIRSTSPQNPADVVGEFPDTDADGVTAVVDSARKAGAEWRRTPPGARAAAMTEAAAALEAAAKELTSLLVREVGKPVTEATGEVARGVAILRYFAQHALLPDGETLPSADGTTLLLARRRPHGVVGLITPWNFPLAIPLWKAAPALAFGNAVVLKPAEEAPAVAARMVDIVAGCLPTGTLSLVTGGGDAGAALLNRTDAVSFTGSAAVGRTIRVRAAERGVPLQCEMGGQNPSIVLSDADADLAARAVASAAMGYAGQKCTATSRAIVVGDADEFAERLSAAVDGLGFGDPADPSVAVGPVITEPARAAVVAAAREAESEGGRVVRGGRASDGSGWYVEPTVVAGLPAHSRLNQEEVFGPICAVIPARDAEDALSIANGVRYGLVGAVFTRDLDLALDLVQRLDVGLARVNAPTSGVDFWAPFGGVKDSSYGPREQGTAAREFYTETVTITISPSGR